MRKLRLAAAVSLALATPGVFALGLGDIEMRSALNQPMNAEIRLTSVKPGELDGMIVKLAAPDAFTRAGIERSPVLTNLRFAVDESGGEPIIRITSNTPVVEPFLNFLLEVDWPQGRMVREYTVLLDPPVFMTPSASGSSVSGDSPALGDRNDGALVAPAPIERDDIASREASSGNAADAEGEIVSLDGLVSDDAALLPPADAEPPIQRGDEGEVVSLTDLGAPNVDAVAARNAAAAADFEFEVETVGNAVDVADDAVAGSTSDDDALADESVASQARQADESTALRADEPPIQRGDEGEIVSLEELAGAPVGGEIQGGGDVNVEQGDTLYEIAGTVAGDEISVEQMMLALLAANRSAFIEGNINLVRAGAILRVPDASEARALTQAQAVAEVGKQAGLWQEYRDGLRAASGTRVAITESGADSDAESGSQTSESAGDAAADTGLSADARAILEDARREILERESLRIVGDDSTSAATATAGDGREGDENASLAAIERRLTFAREELSSTRLEAQDLGDQANELRNTTENFASLIALRQNDIAALEARLAEARVNAVEGDATTGALSGSIADGVDVAGSSAAELADQVAGGAEAAVDGATGAADGLMNGALESTAEAADTGRNALSDAGQELGSVELIDGDASDGDAVGGDTDADAAVVQAVDSAAVDGAQDRPWYQTLVQDPARLAIAGVGGIALLGVLGTLLWRRRRGDDGSFLDGDEQAEFLDGDAVDTFDAGLADGRAAERADVDESGFTGAAIAAHGDDQESADAPTREPAAVAVGAAGPSKEASLDKDDTISEVDVYLAYGLHGQAEEMLTRAVDREPDNPVYARKLLDTYHAQGNGEAFEKAAQDYHARFGGDANPEWSPIAVLGHDLRPQSSLFSGAAGQVDKVGSETVGGDRFADDDFAGLGSVDTAGGSVSRDFDGAESAPMDFDDSDESGLMEQSLDPAFAFDEEDLEATGDFSRIADEVAAERDESVVEFPAYDAQDAPRAVDLDAAPRAGTAAAMDAIDASELSETEPAVSSTPEAGPSVAEFPGIRVDAAAAVQNDTGADAGEQMAGAVAPNSLVDDLTLDLDQLSGELELDGTELLDDDFADGSASVEGDFDKVDALGFPELTSNGSLPSGSIAEDDEDADEVDTMMDLAKAYIDMGDRDSASSTLDEIVKAGTPEQVTEAETLLRKIS